MRSKFPAFYRIHQNDILEKFDDCIFMFDASALLDVFRLKKETSEKIFDVIEHYADQVKIPYHVAEEYNKRIHFVLKDQLKKIGDSNDSFNAFIRSFGTKRNWPYISEKTQKLLEKLKSQIDTEYKEQEEYVKSQLLYGEYQNRMADLLDGKVLDPFTKEEIDEIKKEGADRYSIKTPPGFKDASKDDNRFGDLINWKEILRFAKTSKKNIIFISNDEKEDWVCKENGMTIGPLYELLNEFYREIGSNDRFFHIYTLDRFLALVNEKDKNVVSESVVEEVKDSLEVVDQIHEFGLQNESFYEAIKKIEAWQKNLTKMPDFSLWNENIQKMSSALANIKVDPLILRKMPKFYSMESNDVEDEQKVNIKSESEKTQSEDTNSNDEESPKEYQKNGINDN